ncbi:YaaR family protein [Bacillus atrophaeus]|uniref:YaaR family protein n=1 Tax=Bacillus atrophaeus TaxID=1452 RepID=UPI0022828D42|nr:YaaR family protein [Bacillus atrophaeus]MCY8466793.1 YaaR family protein [Bacillus atrophaeus]MCY8479902.1 YaaR family protein [Bacillus atrophaeus]MCY8961700.1 YaaR family protein [Bacillus atrophaeus]MCY8966101.1 YaaR family protein [Bacillus atrophaeus]MCY9439614.1 YaaR family protein [Bacillus atrophaeus]
MKINQDIRTIVEKKQLPSVKSAEISASFKTSMDSQSSKLKFDQLTRLLSDIEAFGKRLTKSRNFKDLSRFKGLVKRFVKEAVDNGLSHETARSFDLYGNSRKLGIVKEIDEKLIQLTEEMMNQEQPAIDLLERIGEIKGLLINLYT